MYRMTQSTRLALWGALLKEARRDCGLSINGLARRAEVDAGNLSRIERGKQGTSDEMKVRLATAVGKPVGEIFPFDADDEAPVAAQRSA